MVTPPASEKAESTPEYRQLRRCYDMAFREWIAQTQHLRESTAPDPDARRAVESSAAAVRNYRDRIVDLLLTNPGAEGLSESHVREAAYFRWINAGCPMETALPDWVAAERQLLKRA